MRRRDVRPVSGRHLDGVHEPRARVGARVHLVAEVPVLALLSLVGLRVALALRVLGRRGRLDERGVDYRAAPHHDAGPLEQLAQLVEHGLAQPVLLEDVPEPAQRRGVRHLLAHEVDLHEPLHGAGVEDGVLAAFVGQAEPALQQVHAQHRLELAGRPSRPLARVVERRDQRAPSRERHERVHLREELVALGGPPLAGHLEVAERGLPGHIHPRTVCFLDASILTSLQVKYGIRRRTDPMFGGGC